jgi:hypothetical protein
MSICHEFSHHFQAEVPLATSYALPALPEEFHQNAYPCILHGVDMRDEYPHIHPGMTVRGGRICPCNDAKQAYMPSMAISARKHRVENCSAHEVHRDRPGWPTSTEPMYMDLRYVDFASLQG